MDPSKIQDVVEWPVPQRLKNIRACVHCVGLCSYYRRFIHDFSMIAAPLFFLLIRVEHSYGIRPVKKIFYRLKTVFTTAPIPALPKDGLYVLDCDACDLGIEAVLSRRIEGEERVIAYGSRLLSTVERNY